ncbi:MAG: alpha/beta hydrolase [Burkholderiaceae bacterium]
MPEAAPEPALHPDMQILLQARDPAPGQDVHESRRKWREYTARLGRPHPETLAVTEEDVPVGGRAVRVRIYRNRSAQGPQPCLLYIHGGGFTKGDLDSSDAIAWGYAQDAGVTVISVDHRLAPEFPWPAPFDDCYEVLLAVSENAGHFRIDRARIIIGGESSGAFLTASVALRARDEGHVSLIGQVLVCGGAGTAEASSSYAQFGTGLSVTEKDMQAFYSALFAGMDYRSDPYAWPIANPDLSGLPPGWVHCAQIDPTRDDGRAYAARLMLAGNDVVYREARGMLNGFLRARFTGAGARSEYEAICAFIRDRCHPRNSHT